METKKQFITRLIISTVMFITLMFWIYYNGCGKTQRTVIYPEEWGEVKTNDSLIVIKANADTVEIGFNNAKNRQ